MFASYSQLMRRAAGPGAVATTLSLWSESRRVVSAPASRQAHSFLTRITSKTKNSTSLRFLSTSTTSSSRGGFVAWYEGHLSRRPVLTKMVTGSLLWSIGDAVAQVVPDMAAGNPKQDYDYSRTGRAFLYGFALHAPLSHLHFNFLEWMTVKGGFKGLQITVFKTAMEQFVYWSWISNGLYHGAMGAMQGKTLEESWDYIKSVIWETQKVRVGWTGLPLL